MSITFRDLNEFREKNVRQWNSIHSINNKIILSLTKVRLNVSTLVMEPNSHTSEALIVGVRAIKFDIDDIKKYIDGISVDQNVAGEQTFEKHYSLVTGLYKKLIWNTDRFVEFQSRQDIDRARPQKNEVDRIILDLEGALARLRAVNEMLEVKITEKIQSRERESTETLNLFFAVLFFFGMATAFVVTKSITLPMSQVLGRIKDIAMGDGDLTKRIHTRSGGEMSELAAWFNYFLDKTHSIIFTIKNASVVVRATTEQVGQQTNKTTVATAGISKNMMEQSMNVDECAISLGSIDDLIQSSGESTRQAAKLSKIAMDRALQGGMSVNETIQAMIKIEESSIKIEQLVSSINDIASQTNLLAINAAVEATKAGEHGKGFAVVAEEVRKLAERSRKLTGEVTSLIGQSSVRVKAGVDLAKAAGVSLDGIIKEIEAVASLIQRIAASATKQTESSTLVLEFMQKVSSGVRTSLLEMQEVTRATEFTSFEVSKLDALVTQLNRIVGQFKLEIARNESDKEKNPPQESHSKEAKERIHSGISPLPNIFHEHENTGSLNYIAERTREITTEVDQHQSESEGKKGKKNQDVA